MPRSLTHKQRLGLLGALIDGNSERAVERLVGVSRATVSKYALLFGQRAVSLHNTLARELHLSLIECDEVWSFVRKKQSRVTPEEHAAGWGEAYCFTGLAMPSRFIVAWKVGKRDQASADAFMADLRARLVTMPSLTSDGFAAYPSAIEAQFGKSVDYAQVIKNYTRSGRRDDDHRYEPPRDPFITKKAVFGAPDLDAATTSHVERNNGTLRHHIGRMRRLVYAFSKDPARHAAAVALGCVAYNLCSTIRTTRLTPAMAAQVVKSPWELEELLDALLSVPETAAPVAVALTHRKPEETARELPNGRGFLRALPGGKGPSAPPSPAPSPVAPAAPVVVAAPEPAREMAQLDLLGWRPKPKPLPPKGTQITLFGDDTPTPK